MLDPQSKDTLTRFTAVAKKIIYDAERMKKFMGMLGTKEGALMAVHTVMAIIEKAGKPIPPEIAPLLGVNCYMVMVDIAQAVTKHKPDPGIMKGVINTILSDINRSHVVKPPEQQAPQQQPQGIVEGAMA